MQTGNVIDIRRGRSQDCLVRCSVEISFYEEKIHYKVAGLEMCLKDRQALAAALEATANDLRREK